MSYRLALLRRWSRRDRLAVLVVAVSVAFLTGAVLLGGAATEELTAVAAEYGSPADATAYDSPADARAAAPSGSVVLPLARANASGGTVTVVGIPEGAGEFADRTGLALPAGPPPGEVRGPVPEARTVRLVAEGGDDGGGGSASVRVAPRSDADVLPPRWYVARPGVVADLGATEALVLSPTGDESVSSPTGTSTPVRGVLAFFVLGAETVFRAVGLVAAGAAVLLGVTIFSTTRITVRDRRRTIRVARATGATRRTLLALFGVRAGLQTAVGVALGYALGVIAPNLAVNATVFAGYSTSLSVRVTPRAAGLLTAVYASLVAVGVAGGVLAARPTVRRPPAAPTTPEARRGGLSKRLPDALRPTLLDRRAFVPTAATLTVFVTLAVVVASTYGVVAPLASGQGTTVTEPGADHPFDSDVPAAYADELRTRGVPASAEILLLVVSDGQPYVARGASFPAFANVTDAAVVSGRRPNASREAVVGADLLRTLDAEVGDRLLVGGSTESAVERVRVVGAFRAPEPYDDQLVVSLPTARRLTVKSGDSAHLVRTARSPAGQSSTESPNRIEVVEVEAPGSVPASGTLAVTATLVNPTTERRERTVTATLGNATSSATGNATSSATVELAPGERRTVGIDLPAGPPRTAALSVAGDARRVEVVAPDSLALSGVPASAPPGAEPRVRVTTATGDPVGDAAVRVADRTVRTDAEGYARLPLDEAGSSASSSGANRSEDADRYRVVASAGNRSTTARIAVEPGAKRRLRTSVLVTPETATVTETPTARVVVTNPWNVTVERSVAVVGAREGVTEQVRLAPGERTTVGVELPRRSPGEYDVAVTVDGERRARTAYRVHGDPRLAAALASSGRRGATTGIGRALSVVFGNVGLAFGTLLALAGLMTVGGTVAGFASAIAARRRTVGVHRSTGATRSAVLRMVLRDALLVGVAATATAVALSGVALWLFDAAGLLTVYGVRLLSTVDPTVVVGSGAAAVAIALVGAGLAAVRVLATPPAGLLAGDGARDDAGGRARDPTGGEADD